jgi:hypothetical protein
MLRYPDISKAKPHILRAELSKIYNNAPMAIVNRPKFGARQAHQYSHQGLDGKLTSDILKYILKTV